MSKPGQLVANLTALEETVQALQQAMNQDLLTINRSQHILAQSMDNVANNLRAINDILGDDVVKARSQELQRRDAEAEGAKKLADLDAAVERGEVVASAVLTSANDIAVLETRRPDGTLLAPRLAAGDVSGFHPDIQKAIIGLSIGDTAKVESLKIDVTVTAIYAANPDYVAPVSVPTPLAIGQESDLTAVQA